MKICSKCKEKKEQELFYKDRSAKDGRKYSCIDCCKNSRNKENDKLYREANKERIKPVPKDVKKKRNEKYYSSNKEKVKKMASDYYLKNKDKKLEYQKEYQKNNRERRNLYLSERRSGDSMFRLITNVRNLIYNSFYYNGYSKTSKTQDLLGCSFEELKNHFESKFEDWMNWNNRGMYNGEFNYGWDIDHIIPLSSAKNEADLIKLNHYTNLQPLCSKINRDIKKNNIEYDTIYQ